jgi:hypothetical protein
VWTHSNDCVAIHTHVGYEMGRYTSYRQFGAVHHCRSDCKLGVARAVPIGGGSSTVRPGDVSRDDYSPAERQRAAQILLNEQKLRELGL